MVESRRIYYSMGEVSEMFDVKPSLIRFWEQKFDILKPHKNKKGNRMFTPRDIENLKIIYHLVKEKGMTLSGAQKRLKENREGVDNDLEIIEKLQGIKSLLLEIKQELRDGDADYGYEQILISEPMADTGAGNEDGVQPEFLSDIEPTVREEEPVSARDWETEPLTAEDELDLEDDVETAKEIAEELLAEKQKAEEDAKPKIIEQTLF